MKRNDSVRIKTQPNSYGRIQNCLPGGWYWVVNGRKGDVLLENVGGRFYEENELERINR